MVLNTNNLVAIRLNTRGYIKNLIIHGKTR